MDQFPRGEKTPPAPGSELSLTVRYRRDAVLLSPAGRLDLSTCARLRDGLLKHMIEQPGAVIVVLGPDLEIGSDSMTSVFVSVWTRCRGWSSTPLLLATTTDGHGRPGTMLILLLERRPGHLAIATRYFGASPPRPTTMPDLTRTHRLSTACGTTLTPDGAIIWATVSLNRRKPHSDG